MDKSVASELPALRRFSRAIVGQQRVGDAYVAHVLEQILVDASRILRNMPVKISLIKQLARTFGLVGERGHNIVAGGFTPKVELERLIWMLFAVEKVAVEDIAFIIDRPIAEVLHTLAAMGKVIRGKTRADLVIVEPDTTFAFELDRMVRSFGHRVLSIARTRVQALDVFASRRPGLILAEANLMEAKPGADRLADLRNGFPASAIFLTAAPDNYLTGLGAEPAFLISKPFDEIQVEAMIAQALEFDDRARGLHAWRQSA